MDSYLPSQLDRRAFLKRAAALGIVPTAASVLAACGSGGASGTTSGNAGQLIVRYPYDIKSLDPASWTALPDADTLENVFEGLISYKPGTWDVVHTLAESFEPSSDGLRFHFTLKKGIPFHGNYGELTADDVKFSYERIAGLTKPNIHSAYQGDWSTLDRVDTEGKYAGTIVLKKPFAPLMRSTLPVTSGKIVSRKAVEKLDKHFATHPIGTGPYEFASWQPGATVTLRRFAGYGGANGEYAAGARWDEIVARIVTDDGTARSGLLAGDLDFGGIGTGSVDQFQHNPEYETTHHTSLGYWFVAMSVKDPLLGNINLRKAVRAALDVPGIIAGAYDGKWQQARAIIPPAMGLGYWSEAPTYERDLDAAKTYLKMANLGDVNLKLTCQNQTSDVAGSQVIQSNLKDAGIKVNLVPQEAAAYNTIPGNGGGNPHRQLNYTGYESNPDPSWSMAWWTCAQMGLWNWDDLCDRQFDALNRQALVEQDPSRRNDLYVEMQQRWDKQASMAWVAHPTQYYAWKRSSVSPVMRPDGRPYYWDFRT